MISEISLERGEISLSGIKSSLVKFSYITEMIIQKIADAVISYKREPEIIALTGLACLSCI
jgi:hypothetical protein